MSRRNNRSCCGILKDTGKWNTLCTHHHCPSGSYLLASSLGKEEAVATSQMMNLFFECGSFFECVARASGRQDQPWMLGEREETCFVYLAGLPCILIAQRRVHKSDLVQSTYDLTLKPVAHCALVIVLETILKRLFVLICLMQYLIAFHVVH